MFQDSELRRPPPVNGHGGAREGAGRKPGGYEKPAEAQAFDKAKARNEAAKAGINEIKLQVELRRWVLREAVITASATIMSNLAQSLRSLPDELERQGLGVDWCEKVGATVDAVLAEAAAGMELMAGPPPLELPEALGAADDDAD